MTMTSQNQTKHLVSDFFSLQLIEKTYLVFVFLLGISLYVSKSGLTFFALIVLVFSFFSPFRKAWAQTQIAFIFIGLFVLFAITQIFSMAGPGLLLSSLKSWPFLLMALPALVIYKNKIYLKYFSYGCAIGLTIGSIYSLILFFKIYGGQFTPDTRVPSFWDIGRWGTFTALATISLWIIFCYHLFSKHNVKALFSGLLFILAATSLILSNTRGPLMGAAFALGLFSLINTVGRKYIAVIFAASLALVLLNPSLRERLESIFHLQKIENHYVAQNISNEGRLNMWKVSIDFLKEHPLQGTGFENYEGPLKEFLSHKSQDYLDLYTRIEFSYRDQHNSYLFTFVQMGTIFAIIFWLCVFYLYLKNSWPLIWQDFKRIHPENIYVWICFSVVTAHLLIFFFYSSIASYEALTFISPLAALALGKELQLSNNQHNY